ncbi:MAG: hypothetical protein R2830_15895 [Saprospiraceae bacterium]
MKQPFWKQFLSYFTEIELESTSSDLNPDLMLSLKKGRYYLTTPNAIYSYGDLYDNFSRTFQRMDLGKRDIKDVLILGFGLGSIPFMLETIFKQKYRYTGVEADETIAIWASDLVLRGLQSPIEMHIQDAAYFVETCDELFDLVIMDIFLDDKIPDGFQELEFVENLRHLTAPDGILLFNCLAFSEEDKTKAMSFYESTFKKVFPEGTYLDLGGNWMLINRAL